MKTLLFTLEYPPMIGGVSNYYHNLVKHWPGEIFVLDNNKNKLLARWLWPKWLPALSRLWQVIRKEKIKHILVGHVLPLGTVTYCVSRLTGTPYTVFLHGMDFTYALAHKRKKKITRKILLAATNIICASRFTASLVREFLGEKGGEKIKIIYPGVARPNFPDLEKVKTALRKKYNLDGKFILLSIGRLVKRKGFDMVIKALPEILKYVPNLYYILAGDGPDKKYIYECAKGVPNIFFLGKISEKEKWAWLELADIFIMPTRVRKKSRGVAGLDFEGFGIVYLEASLAGKPVIGGEGSGAAEAVKSAVTGILVDGRNREKISGAVIRLAQDVSLRQKFGKQGKARAEQEFGWEEQTKKIYNLII
jgi:phosphatidylinositol alpha-1,6-mannosyltransferase